MSADEAVFQSTTERLRHNQDELAVRVSREHYLWLADEIARLREIEQNWNDRPAQRNARAGTSS